MQSSPNVDQSLTPSRNQIKSEQDLEIFFQDLDIKGNAKSRTRGKRRKYNLRQGHYESNGRGDDGLVDAHGEKLKPKEIDKFIRRAYRRRVRGKWRSNPKSTPRIMSGDQNLVDGWIEVTSTVSALDQKVGAYFADYTGKSLKKNLADEFIPKSKCSRYENGQ